MVNNRPFKNSSGSNLLCDLDAMASEIDQDLLDNGIFHSRNSVFYMIQEMEAWFISQPEILDKFYITSVSKKLPKKPASEFIEPDKELQRITQDIKKGVYHKVKHGAQLLKQLDADKLYNEFPEFKRLIEKLLSN
jgi:hypothetical protein